MSSTTEKAMLRSHDAARAEIAALCGDQAETDGYDYTTVLNGFLHDHALRWRSRRPRLCPASYIRSPALIACRRTRAAYDLAMTNSVGMIEF